MQKILRDELLSIVNDIDSGSCHLDDASCEKLVDIAREFTRRDNLWSKYQAYTFLNMSRAQFDRDVKDGKIPKGKKVAGFKELFWKEKEIRALKK